MWLLPACYLYLFIPKNKRINMRQLLKKISEVGSENGLTFSSNEILKQSIIGADGIHRKVVVIKNQIWMLDDYLIDLHEVKNCSVKKVLVLLKPVNWLERIWNSTFIKFFCILNSTIINNQLMFHFIIILKTAFISLRKWSLKQSIGKLYSLKCWRVHRKK